MGDTQVLLSKIAALRQRLEQVRKLADDAGSAAVSLLVPAGAAQPKVAETPRPGPLQILERQVDAACRDNASMDGVLRQLAEATLPPSGTVALPAQLTARARRLIEQSRELLGSLRALADDPILRRDENEGEPLALVYRETAAMIDTGLRIVQAFPDVPSAQLRLCDGLEAILTVTAERVATLVAALDRRRLETARINLLADLLAGLEAGKVGDVKPFSDLAEALIDDVHQAAPLRFHEVDALPANPTAETGSAWRARFAACHSLVVGQVVARLIRHDPEWTGRSTEPVLAALLHDVGMLRVPADILARPEALSDEQRRSVEAHTWAGAEMATRLLPRASWLAEAAAGHHERLDGTGYPAGMRDVQITPLNRLLAVCDVYAALCVSRPHRPARETRTALADTLLLAEQGALDRFQAERLLVLSFYPAGSVVELADGATGLVVATHTDRNNLSNPARPVVALLTDPQGRPLPSPRHLDLAQCDGHSIVRTLSPAERRRLLGKRYPELAA